MSNLTTIAARRDEGLLALADAIVLADEVGKLDTFVDTYNATAKALARKPARTPKPTAAWRSHPITSAQAAFIVKYSDTHGFDAVMTDNWTKGMADMYIKEMRAMVAADTEPATIAAPVNAIDWDTDGRDDSGYGEDDSTSLWIERIEGALA